MTHILSN